MDEMRNTYPQGPRSEQGTGDKYAEAIRRSNDVPGDTLAAQVEYALTRRVYSVDALRAVSDQLRKIDAGLAVRFWRLCGTYLDDSAAKQALVAEVKALEPQRPEPVKAEQMPTVPFTGDLSERIESAYGIGRELRELTERAR